MYGLSSRCVVYRADVWIFDENRYIFTDDLGWIRWGLNIRKYIFATENSKHNLTYRLQLNWGYNTNEQLLIFTKNEGFENLAKREFFDKNIGKSSNKYSKNLGEWA